MFDSIRSLKEPKIVFNFSILELKIYITQYHHYKEEIFELWSLDKVINKIEYAGIKESIPAIKPHANFNGYGDTKYFKNFTGYLYFDIDKCDVKETKKIILKEYSDYIVMMGKSVGGKGLFFLIKVNPELLTLDNFLDVHNNFRTIIFKKFNLDDNAGGINRSFVIPFDEDLYFNENAEEFDINFKLLEDKKGTLRSKISTKEKKEECSTTKYTFSPISISTIIKKINNQTFLDTGKFDAIIVNHQSAKVYFRNQIIDGTKHKTFNALVNSILFNNPDFSLLEIQSYIYWLNQNKTVGAPMKLKELLRTTEIEYRRIKSGGEIFGTRTKGIAIKKNIPKREKRLLTNKLIGKMKKNKSFFLIKAAIIDLEEQNQKPTQKKVAEILKGKLGITTIKKYWKIVRENDLIELTKILIDGYKINDETTAKLNDLFAEPIQQKEKKKEVNNKIKNVFKNDKKKKQLETIGRIRKQLAENNFLKMVEEPKTKGGKNPLLNRMSGINKHFKNYLKAVKTSGFTNYSEVN